MGIDVSHSLLVGASYEELEGWLENKVGEYAEDLEVQDIIEEYFETASPYYDSPLEDQFLGFRIPNFQVVSDLWYEAVRDECDRFEVLTGVKPRIRGGAHVW